MMALDSIGGELQGRARMLQPVPIRQVDGALHQRTMTRMIDDTIEASFPASDPPSWTFSVARPASADVNDVTAVQRLLRRLAALF